MQWRRACPHHAANHFVEMRLDSGAGYNNAVPFHAAPESSVAGEEKMRHDIGAVIVAHETAARA
jgi:hypothetical protein